MAVVYSTVLVNLFWKTQDIGAWCVESQLFILSALWPVYQESGEGVMWSILSFLLHVWTGLFSILIG